jgi:hypothetical protein
LFLEALAEADKEDVDELPIVDGIPKFLELIGDGFEALTVNAHWRIALHGVAKFRVKRVDAGIDVVLKKAAKGRPKSGDAGGLAEDEIEDFCRHPLVDPLDDGEVILDPARI